MRRPYEKPTVASEEIFAMTSQGCDYSPEGLTEAPFVCSGVTIRFTHCWPQYKPKFDLCALPPPVLTPNS
jgi:hypothetical protein